MNIYRIPWLIGQFLPLGSKLGHHLFETDSSQVRFWRATGEYIFLDPIAAYKTTLNLSVEFCMGAVYIDRLPAPYMPSIEMPHHWAAVFGIAFAAELIVPMALDGGVEWCRKKIKKWNED